MKLNRIKIQGLLEQISKSDDQRAFKKLFDHYYSWLFTVAYTIVESTEDAEDVLEDIFVKIWEIRDRYDDIANIETYLYTSVRNKCYDLYRKEAKVKHIEMDDTIEPDLMESPEELYLYQELQKKIEDSINKLPHKCKEVYLLIRENGYSYKDAAEELSVSIKTIESQMRIAVKKIAVNMQTYLETKEDKEKGVLMKLSMHLLTF